MHHSCSTHHRSLQTATSVQLHQCSLFVFTLVVLSCHGIVLLFQALVANKTSEHWEAASSYNSSESVLKHLRNATWFSQSHLSTPGRFSMRKCSRKNEVPTLTGNFGKGLRPCLRPSRVHLLLLLGMFTSF